MNKDTGCHYCLLSLTILCLTESGENTLTQALPILHFSEKPLFKVNIDA